MVLPSASLAERAPMPIDGKTVEHGKAYNPSDECQNNQNIPTEFVSFTKVYEMFEILIFSCCFPLLELLLLVLQIFKVIISF